MPPKNAITRWEVTDFKLREPYAEFFIDHNFELGRELPYVLELFNFIINETEHFNLMCHELEAIKTYRPVDNVLVVL